MEKGTYQSVPYGELELTDRNDDEETPPFDCAEASLPSSRERSSSRTLMYSFLFVCVFVIMSLSVYNIVPENTLDLISEDAALESGEKEVAPEHLPVATTTPISAAPTTPSSPAPLPVHTYVGPTLPDVITTCPSLDYYQTLPNNLDVLCDDTGRNRTCLCQNPTIPRIQDDTYRYKIRWDMTLKRNIGMAKPYANSPLDVLLLGDSLTEHWIGTDIDVRNHDYDGARLVYQQYFEDGTIRGLALGIAGDRIPHLLYRMEQGEMVTNANAIWVNIGTNDLGGDHCTVDAVVAGNIAVVEYILSVVDTSQTKVVLNSLLPRCGHDANDTHLIDDRNWQEAMRINKYLECYAQVRGSSALEFFDATSLFVTQDNSDDRNATLYQDPIHLSTEGYRVWGKAITERVEQIKMEMSGDDQSSSQHCGEASTTSYFDDLVNRASTSSANRCKIQPCSCLDPQIPVTNTDTRMYKQWAKTTQRNQDQLIPYLTANSTVELMLMGDSITELWLGTAIGAPMFKYKDIPDVFDDIFSKESTMVMGIAADKSSYLLHRIQNGELPFELNVSVVWILIGTNDITDGCNVDTIVAGNTVVVKEIMRRQPKARVVINSILPRMDAGFDVIPLVNEKLRCFAESAGNVVSFFEATSLFLRPDGTTNTDLYTDGVHPNKQGYEIWGRAIKEFTKSLNDKGKD